MDRYVLLAYVNCMAMDFVILSEKCALSKKLGHTYGDQLLERGFNLIALDNPMSYCVIDLLNALQVTEVPTMRVSGKMLSGREAFEWARTEFGGRLDSAPGGLQIQELRALQPLRCS